VFERDPARPNGHLAFIAALPPNDTNDEALGAANVTPDGRFLVFGSSGALTGDDTSQIRAAQVFEYDAQSATLTRISVGNNGFNDNGNAGSPSLCAGQSNGCTADATIVGAQTDRVFEDGGARRDPTMSDDGALVFFQSPAALTPHALNYVQIGTQSDVGHFPTYAQNVYEYHAGHVYLLSDGRDTATIGNNAVPAARLLGSSSDGANVFFTTVDPLVPQDTDTQLDIYDARVCSTASPCIQAPLAALPCSGDVCQGRPSGQPGLPSLGSVTFAGPGNPSGGPVRGSAGRVKILRWVVRGARVALTVTVPGAGRITIAGAAVETVTRSVSHAGAYLLGVTLTAKARRGLAPRRRLNLRLRVRYEPAAGARSSVATLLTVRH
jgi:hypothetical protein